MDTVLITGGNRGIGKGLVERFMKTHKVYFTVREKVKGDAVIQSLSSVVGDVHYLVMDTSDESSIVSVAKDFYGKGYKLDLIINNAGVYLDEGQSGSSVTSDVFMDTIRTNTLGPLLVIQNFLPSLKKGSRVINISSRMGQMTAMGLDSLAYRTSKAALNAVSVILNQDLKQKGICVSSMCPGWVRTDMGGQSAFLAVEESADGIYKVATSDDFPAGKFLIDGGVVGW